jgi:thiamine-phosphate pyrophosphorylase
MEKPIYRILDANFNRAREALRVMEEYCRFVLNNPALGGRAKQLRHALSSVIAELDANQLLACRDSQRDVGKELRVTGQMKRATLEDCFTAAAKRSSEALRMLAEVGQTINPALYDRFEKLRFETYSLEKDISLAMYGILRFQNARLYVLITVQSESDKAKVLDLAKACIAGGADCLQLRCKAMTDKDILNVAGPFVESCRQGDVISIINDRPDIAILSGADGVHLGQEDLSAEDVRRLQPRPLIVGRSTHHCGQLTEAMNETCDYVALGPVFATATKSHEPVAGLDYVRQAINILKDSRIGHVAIGGIDLNNIEQVLALGVKTVAVCSAVCDSSNPAGVCGDLKKRILSYGMEQ